MFAPDGQGGDVSISATPVFFDPSRRRWTGFLAVTSAALVAAIAVFSVLSFNVYQGAGRFEIALADRSSEPPTTIPDIPVQPRAEIEPTPEQAPALPVEPTLALAEAVAALATPVIAAPAPPQPPMRPQGLMAQPQQVPAREPIPTPSIHYLGTGAPAPEARPAPSFVELVMGAVGSVLVSEANATEFIASAAPETYAFHANWSLEGISSLKQNVGRIDTLLPEWVHLADGAGNIDFSLPHVTENALADIAAGNPAMRVIPVLSDQKNGLTHSDHFADIAANPEARATLVSGLVEYLLDKQLHGIAVRISEIERIEKPLLTQLLREMKQGFSAYQLQVYMILPGEDGLAYADAAGPWVDAIIVEGWGETVSGEAPGPLASQEWFTRILAQWRDSVPADRLVFAIRNVAYDWSAGAIAQQISTLEALNRARLAGESVTLDGETLNTHFTYSNAAGERHEVWMLDGVSAYNQLRAIMQSPPRGIALSRLGNEDGVVWNLLAAPGSETPSVLEQLDYGTHISRQGQGEIIKLTQEPQPGARNVTVAASGLVTGATVTAFPRSYEISHWGGDDPNLIALTFDDGPDPVFTPLILDVLEQLDVPATFFATGGQMLRHPDVVNRIIGDGHEMGNHTYSHTNISRMTPEMLRLDLNAAQLVFSSITGRNLVLFRAPFATDANPEIAAEIAPLATIGELGYVTVNMNIDPKDWWAPDADRIVSTTIRQVESGLGNIVLLHDAGGNRDQTIAALPRIIEDIRAKGYRFVPVSSLLGLTTDDVMPPAPAKPALLSQADKIGVALMRFVEIAVSTLFVVAIALGIGRAVILIVLASLRRRPAHLARPLARGPKLAVIVPAYNEEKVIVKTIQSLLASTYHDFEILVVDDGSRDRTLEVCRAQFGNTPGIRILSKPNGGKAAALNYGIERTEAEIIVALDADTIFLPHTIGWLAARFADGTVAAVAGNAKVGNRNNLLTRWQATEYITSQNLDRHAFEVLNCITVVPGAVGAWRRSAVIAAGGYSRDTLAEDADLTIRLLRAGHKIVYEDKAIAFTEAPETSRQLFRQRFRWMFGMLQVSFKHKDALMLKDSKSVGLIALPHLFIFQILFPLVAPIADFVALLIIGELAVRSFTQSSMMGINELALFLGAFFAFMLLDLLSAVIAFAKEKSEDWRLIFWLPFQRFYYRQLLYLVAIKAALTAMRGSLVGWGNLARTASVKLDAARSAR